MPVEFNVKLGPNIENPNLIVKAGLEAGTKAWITTMRRYPAQAPGVAYKRTKAMSQKTIQSMNLIDEKGAELTSTEYAPFVLLRQNFNGGFIVWANKAQALIDNVKAAFRAGVREATGGR